MSTTNTGNLPLHYSASIGQAVFKIYSLTRFQTEADKNLGLDFGIENFDRVITTLKELETRFSLEPIQTEFGFMAIILIERKGK